MKVTSHVEKLAQSACQRASGDRLWCGTCHDPHAVPVASGRAAWFRNKCLTCHDAAACKETKIARAARQDDCTSCHMPKSPVADAQHVVYTDHSIPRRPRGEPSAASADLAVFGGARAEPRDLALAFGIVASRSHTQADQARALTALEHAAHDSPSDVEVLLYLAELYRTGDREERAIPLYRRAIELDPSQVTAPVGLGGILMERGQYAEAIGLWQDALAKNGGLELVRINMAMAQWRSGDLPAAERTLVKAIELNPGFDTPVDLLQKLREQMRQAR
jgi:Flp pilus assembly protein TadD